MSNGVAVPVLPGSSGRRLRYDRVDPSRPNRGLGWSLTAGLDVNGARSLPKDRRTEPRLEPARFVCRLRAQSWFSSWQQDALIINISRGGALVFLDEPPPGVRKLGLELRTPKRNVFVPAKALDVRRTRSGQAAVRIAFSRPWPYDLFETAVCGLAPARPCARPRGNRRGTEGEIPGNRSEL